ncbi:MAG: DUF3794 domain-containing protein [Clostridioides sp.]|jgi:hypothetical protein|nr:DUF3794 domain-containing protein [Clostridioides sp.]
MELIKDVIKLDNRIDFGKYQTFIEAETVVPDKKMDVYEIVKTEGYISFRKVEAADGKILLRGTFNYNVIYIADDKNTVSNVDGKIDINEVIEKDIVLQDINFMLYPEVEHIDCTIMNERKLKIGALMNVKGSLFDKKELEIVKDVDQVEGIQKHRKEINFQDIIGIEKSETTIRDSINVNTDEIREIISLSPSMKVKESRVTDNKVIVGGVLEVNPLATTYENEIVELDKIGIDFTQFVDMPGVTEGMTEEILLRIGDFNFNFSPNNDSSNGVLEIDCTASCKCKVTDEVTREVLQDAYSPQTVLKFDQKPIKLNKRLCNDEESFTIRDSISSDKTDGIQINDIVSVSCNASIENAFVEENTNTIQGIIKLDVLYVPEEGLKKIYRISEEVPFEHDLAIEDMSDSSSVFNTIVVEKVEADLNRDEIDFAVKLRRFTEAIDKDVESFIVKGEDQGAYDLTNSPSIIVYVCKEGDTFWDIAKKYNTTEQEIADINDLAIDETLRQGKCLILEKKVEPFC